LVRAPLQVIECVPTEHITNLLDTFSGNLVSLSQHPFGCRVMQRILEHCTDQARYNVFMTEILKVGICAAAAVLHSVHAVLCCCDVCCVCSVGLSVSCSGVQSDHCVHDGYPAVQRCIE
jgi:hypothetical protein